MRFWLVVVLLAYTLAGFFLAPWIAKRQLLATVGELVQRPVTLEKVRINPYMLSVEASGFTITEQDGRPLLGFDRLYINFQLSSLLRWAWSFRDIRLEGAYAELIHEADGSINLARLIPPAAEPEPPEDQSLPRLLIGSLILADGQLGITDHSRDNDFATRLAAIDLQMNNLSTLPDRIGRLAFFTRSVEGATLGWTADIQLVPMLATGHLVATGPYLPLAYRYFRDLLNVAIPRGDIDLRLDHSISYQAEVLEARIDNLDLGVDDLQVIDNASDEGILELPRLALQGGHLSWPEQRAGASEFSLAGARLSLWRQQDGSLSVQHLLVEPASAGQVPITEEQTAQKETVQKETVQKETVQKETVHEQVAHRQVTPESTKSDALEPEVTEPEATEPQQTASHPPAAEPAAPDDGMAGWQLELGELAVADLSLTFEDHSLAVPGSIRVDDLDLRLTELTNRPGDRFPLSFAARFAEGGTLTLNGTLGFLPYPELDATLAIDELALAIAQPYLADYASAGIDDGRLKVDGKITVNEQQPFAIEGRLQIDQLAVVETRRNRPLVSWQQLGLDRFRYSLHHNQLDISSLALDQPYARVLIASDGVTNFQKLLIDKPPAPGQGDEPAQADTDNDAKPFGLTLDQTTISRGSTDFSDRSLPIPFSAQIADLAGKITAIDSASTEPAFVRLEGQVEDYGLARIEGSLRPFGPLDYTNIQVLFRNVEVPDLTPYTIKFAGRAIARGRMDLDLRYRVESGQLAGKNNIVITDLTLGDKVEYEGALDLPLGLAVALLKGPDGKIRIDLPVEGDVNNPSFQIGGVIRTAIVNLITGIVTAPFRMLGSLVGAGENDFDRLEFDPGRAVLAPPEREKLDKLVEALALRPQLALEVPGAVAPQVDRPALQQIQLQQRIDTALAEAGGSDGGDKRLRQRRRAILEDWYRESFPEQTLDEVEQQFMKPVDPAQPEGRQALDEIAYAGELYQRLVAVEPVDDAALDQLARDRAAAVARALTANDGLTNEGLTPKGLAAERVRTTLSTGAAKVDSGRVSLMLAVGSVDGG